jgi:hypothetical protein
MKFAYLLSSSTPVIKKYKASAAQAVGTVVIVSAANASGQMTTSTTTGAAGSLGLCVDNGIVDGAPLTYSTTQGANEAVFGVIVNPDAVLRAQMVTGATGTAITEDTVATAVSNGLTVVGGTSVASPDMDEGLIWFTSGSNVGKSRKITSTSSVTATVIVPFPYASAVGDKFLYAGVNIGLRGVTLTTDLKNVRADIAVSTGAAAATIDVELGAAGDSWVHLVLTNMVWNNAS